MTYVAHYVQDYHGVLSVTWDLEEAKRLAARHNGTVWTVEQQIDGKTVEERVLVADYQTVPSGFRL